MYSKGFKIIFANKKVRHMKKRTEKSIPSSLLLHKISQYGYEKIKETFLPKKELFPIERLYYFV